MLRADDEMRQRREKNFRVRAEPQEGMFKEFEGEKRILISYNGRQDYPFALAPHEARKLYALLAAEFGLNNWEPIELAPRDGTELLLTRWTPECGYGITDFGAWELIEHDDTTGQPYYDWSSNSGYVEDPTHFMRVAPPTHQPIEESKTK